MDNFKVNLLKNIEAEIMQLGGKITKIREGQGNSAEYKNLIQAYKEIVDVYYKVKDDIDDKVVIHGVNEENGTMTYGEFDTRCQKRSIERTIFAIDAVKDLPEELSRDVKHFIKNNSKCEFWEVKKELTPLNHLLFCSGSLQICDIHYKIDGKKIQFDKGNEFWQDNNLRIVWLDENDPEKDLKIKDLEKRLEKLESLNKENNFQDSKIKDLENIKGEIVNISKKDIFSEDE